MNATTNDEQPTKPARHRLEEGYLEVTEGRKRLLITGSRDWANQPAVAGAILQQWIEWDRCPVTLVHGGAAGADTMAGEVFADQSMHKIEVHPALWDVHGKAAGYVRNAEMVSLGADACIAFIRNNSRGATMCLELAEAAGIPCTVYRLDES